MSDGALYPHLAARGAVPGVDRGVRLPQHFGDPAAEYRALCDAAVLLDLGHRTLVRATGADRVTFLQGMLTNDVAGLRPGEGCPAFLLTVQGRVTADVRVAAGADAVLLDVDVRARAAFLLALESRIIADEVELLEPREASTLLGVEGPAAAAVLGQCAGTLAPYAHVETEIDGVPVRVVRASEVLGPGFVVHVAVDRAGVVWEALAARGARPCGMEAVEGRRIEVGVPRIGLDMGEDTLVLEVPAGEAVSHTKGCYLGQEVVARGTARGHINRRLCGLVLDAAGPLRGTSIEHAGREVGHVTSVAHAFGLGRPAALAMVRRECWEPGTALAVGSGETGTRAVVAAWPLA